MALSLLVSRIQQYIRGRLLRKKRTRNRDRGKTATAPKTAVTIHRKCKDGLVRPYIYVRGVDASVAKYFRTSKKWDKKNVD